MEGYVLGFQKERQAQLWYCVLEHGALQCYNRPDGELVQVIELTRHRIRLENGLEGVCPNRFVIHSTPVGRDDNVGKFVLLDTKESSYFFAAPSPDKMRKWCRAILNWRRHSFVDPAQSLTASKIVARRPDDEPMSRKAIQKQERLSLVHFVTAFELILKEAAPPRASPKRGSLLFRKSSSGENTEKRRSLIPLRPGQVVKAMASLPTRVPNWRRVSSSSSS
ncbi:hypothetical protein Poli38472_004141 [Pythium oligandrum]|uniref:PH domain-containing protein n=1 Tax=Pythium oligandrum TaxID=41045 RepID=A0A8K1FKS6_PYTOL|nr:hypothetical protein Poli38472_004141 [Pythium oligandrum]|eukprot:TMW66376.1 hypothetical protein Poli38472_004141 [Pythium oligandrum]